MKNVRRLLLGMAMALAVLNAGVASAATTWGTVTFVGTISEESHDGGFSARLHVRVNGACDTDSAVADRWIIIRSGRMEGIYAHNGVNMKNAYSTLMAAFLANKTVEIGGLPDCSTTSPILMDLWTGKVGMV
jgi:hypothetical protein